MSSKSQREFIRGAKVLPFYGVAESAAGSSLPSPQKHKLLLLSETLNSPSPEQQGQPALARKQEPGPPSSNINNSLRAKSVQSENARKMLKKLPSGPGKHVIFQTRHSISVFLCTNLALCPLPPAASPPPTTSPFTLSTALTFKSCLHFSLYLIFHIIRGTYHIFVVIYSIPIPPLTLEKAITFPSCSGRICQFCTL